MEKGKDVNKPLTLLYTLLPQSTLGVWMPTNTKMFNFEEEFKPVSNDSTPSTEPLLNIRKRILKPKRNMVKPRTMLKKYVPRPKVTRVNVLRPMGTKVSVPTPSVTEYIKRTEPTRFLQGAIEKPIPLKYIKLELNEEDSQNMILDDALKTENVTVPYIEIVPEHNIYSKNDVVPEKKYVQMQIKVETETDDDPILNSDDDNVLGITSLNHVEDLETESIVTDKPLDDSSTDSDDNNVKTKVKKRCSTRNKKSLAKQAKACLSDDDSINSDDEDEAGIKDEEVTDDDENEEWNTANGIIADMENVNAELDSINDNYEKIMLQSGNTVQKNKTSDIIKKNNKHVLNRTGFEKMVRIICKDMDDIQENCEKLIQTEDGPSSIHKRIKTLKEDLTAKFESCGELKSVNGVVIDKEHVLNCLDGRASGFLIDILWKAVDGKRCLTLKAVKILALIQSKYSKSNKYESVFDIEYMNTPEAMKEEIQKRQTYPWYINAQYKCELCYTVFKYEAHLEKHMKMHDDNSGDFLCPICGVRHKLKRDHIKHLTIHEIVYKCKLCPLVTYYKYSMMHHYDQHRGVKYICEPCNKMFPSASAYNTHRAYKHRRDHVCTVCGRTFDTEEIRDTHQKAHRVQSSTDGSTGVKCDKCELTFPSQKVYERHTRFTHGARFSWTSRILKPQKHSDKPKIKKKAIFTCPVCQAFGGTYGWLVLHGRLEHGTDLNVLYEQKRSHLCDVCGKGYSNKYILRDHMNTHTGVRQYPCELCPKRFYTPFKLKKHRQFHFPPTQLCTHCGKKFHTQSNLHKHMQSHIRDRRYKCNICGKGFIHTSMLAEHIRGVHKNLRRVRKRGC